MDYSIHPLDPMAFRLTLAGPIDTIDILGMAAEFGRAVPAFAPPSAHYDWTGFYVGGYGEYSWARPTAAPSTCDRCRAAPISGNLPNWHGGIQLGFDYMMPSRLLIGVAADVTSGGTRTTTVTDAFGTSANQTTVFDSETVRGRFGYALDNVLLYGTAGGRGRAISTSVRSSRARSTTATAGADEAVNKYLSGWTAGAGVSVAFAQNWNVFAEYRYTSFGSSTFTLPLSELSTTSTTKVSAIEFGVNYMFNGSGPAGRICSPPFRAADIARSRHVPLPPLQLDRFLLRRGRRLWLGDIERSSDDGAGVRWRRTATA